MVVKKISKKAPQRQLSAHTRPKPRETDGQYLLKLVLVILLGTLWLKFATPASFGQFQLAALPVGMLFGLVLISQLEHYQTDRKIWYAILIVVSILCYFVPAGIMI